jgi:hypothetical protein
LTHDHITDNCCYMCCLISCCTATAPNRRKADVSGNNSTNVDADIDDDSIAADSNKNDDDTAADITNAAADNANTSAGKSYIVVTR